MAIACHPSEERPLFEATRVEPRSEAAYGARALGAVRHTHDAARARWAAATSTLRTERRNRSYSLIRRAPAAAPLLKPLPVNVQRVVLMRIASWLCTR